MSLENSDMLTTAIAYVSLISQCLSIAACGGLGRERQNWKLIFHWQLCKLLWNQTASSYFYFTFLGAITPKNHQYVLLLFTATLGIANIIPIFINRLWNKTGNKSKKINYQSNLRKTQFCCLKNCRQKNFILVFICDLKLQLHSN